MIKTKTLFILGAGASKPFGYPTGIELREIILRMSVLPDVVSALTPVNEESTWYEKSVLKFISEFLKSSVYSIDYFLEKRPEFTEIGKMSIAACLIGYEKDQELRNHANGNWYMYLYDRLKSSFEDFDKNNISFITFNYDRSLEQFFHNALKSTFNKSNQECADKLKEIPIVHLYGHIGLLPWQLQDSNDEICFPYTQEVTKQRVVNALKTLKLINSERRIEDSEEFKAAYKLIETAQRIYFMGFGFDEVNLERLDIKLMGGKSLIATAYGLDASTQKRVTQDFQTRANSDIFLDDKNVLALLKDYLQYE